MIFATRKYDRKDYSTHSLLTICDKWFIIIDRDINVNIYSMLNYLRCNKTIDLIGKEVRECL